MPKILACESTTCPATEAAILASDDLCRAFVQSNAAFLASLQRSMTSCFDEITEMQFWVPVLNHLDAYLEASIKTRRSVRTLSSSSTRSLQNDKAMDVAEAGVDNEDDVTMIIAILKFTIQLLRNTVNKNVYNSTEVLYSFPSSTLFSPCVQLCFEKSLDSYFQNFL